MRSLDIIFAGGKTPLALLALYLLNDSTLQSGLLSFEGQHGHEEEEKAI